MFKLRPHGQAVKTPPFHGGIPSSNLGRVTTKQVPPAHGGSCNSTKYRRTKSEGYKKFCEYCLYGSIAQLGEHLPYKQGVTGSSPVTSTNYLCGLVVQLVRMLPCHGRGRGFESHLSRHCL